MIWISIVLLFLNGHLFLWPKCQFFKIRKSGLISNRLIWHTIIFCGQMFLNTHRPIGDWWITCCLSVFMKISAAWVLPGRPSQVSFLRSHPAFTKNCPELTWLCQVNQHSGELCCGLLNKRKQTALINVSRRIRQECVFDLWVWVMVLALQCYSKKPAGSNRTRCKLDPE